MTSTRPRPPPPRSPVPPDDPFSPYSPSPQPTIAAASTSASGHTTSPTSSTAGAAVPFPANDTARANLLEDKLALRSAEFTEHVPLLLHLATWNVNAKRPEEDITPWLLSPQQAAAYSQYDVETLDIDASHLVEPDVYVVGFQEIVDLNAGNLLVDHNATRPWEDKIERLLKQRYVQVANKALVGLALLVYVRRALAEFVSDVVVKTAGVGIMGVGGNKGAVCVSMFVYDSHLVFVNSHLAAHQGNKEGRNSDFHAILQKVRFPDRRTGGSFGLLDRHVDHVFWIGDLNYRIDLVRPDPANPAVALHRLAGYDELVKVIKRREWPTLHQLDQLIEQKKAAKAFDTFHEAPIAFEPTYKYAPGTNDYDTRNPNKVRLPAWCDRIQWTGDGVECLAYTRRS